MSPEPGLTFTLVYDSQGKVINVASGPPRDAATALKQMMTGLMPTAAPLTLAIGETATVPDHVDLPLPTGQGASDAMTMSGETRYTLTSVTVDGADRIAHLTIRRTATVSRGSPAAGPGPQAAFEQHTTSDGAIDVNIDRGVVLHSRQQMAIDGTVRMDTRTGAAALSTRTHGTVTLASDVVK